ncbi:MAG: PAS domain-containing protein [Chlorobiales bacterium]|nr:PAS domain-containing protein [Chlorobiales bacterium]
MTSNGQNPPPDHTAGSDPPPSFPRKRVPRHRDAKQLIGDLRALYISLVENLPLHVLRKDLKGRIVFANRSFCELLGKPLAEIKA